MLAIPFYAGAGLAVLGLAFTIFDRFILKTGLPSWITILVFATDSALVLWLQKRINEYTGAMKSLNDRYDLKQDEHQ
ncbi:MAG: hypothetical protein Q8S35_01415, partial [bacterium]|nr:hypothetical protein [bacterium]